MNTLEVANKLAEIDAPDEWITHCPPLSQEEKHEVFNLAERLWLEKTADSGKLLVHPDILKQLEDQQWVANDLQKRMIWASVLASAEGDDSKVRFKKIKLMLIKKYGRDWWEDVFNRKNSAWAAKERIRKRIDNPAMSILISKTVLLAGAANEERDAALRMIPSS